MILALDAMGGDHAPYEPCKGAILACTAFSDLEVVLVGDEISIKKSIEEASGEVQSRLHVIHADETISMAEVPARAIRKKRRSSMRIAMQMVHSKEVQGFVSAGNTGAIVAGGILLPEGSRG